MHSIATLCDDVESYPHCYDYKAVAMSVMDFQA